MHTRRTCHSWTADATCRPPSRCVPCTGSRERTHSTVGPAHSTVGPGPQYCGPRPTVLWCNQSDLTATHTNVKCSHSTPRRCSNIAHAPHRQPSGRMRGIQVSNSQQSPDSPRVASGCSHSTVGLVHSGSPLCTMRSQGWRPKAASQRCSPKTADQARFVSKGEHYSLRTERLKFQVLCCILRSKVTPPPGAIRRWGPLPVHSGTSYLHKVHR